jgi:hypothetical protein
MRTAAAATKKSSVPTVFNIIKRTYILAATTKIVKAQKTPLIARIDGALVELSVAVAVPVTVLSLSNLKTEGISKWYFALLHVSISGRISFLSILQKTTAGSSKFSVERIPWNWLT